LAPTHVTSATHDDDHSATVFNGPNWNFTQHAAHGLLSRVWNQAVTSVDYLTGLPYNYDLKMIDIAGPAPIFGGIFEILKVDGGSYNITEFDSTYVEAYGSLNLNGAETQVEGLFFLGRNWATTPDVNPDVPYLQLLIQIEGFKVAFELIYHFDLQGNLVSGGGTVVRPLFTAEEAAAKNISVAEFPYVSHDIAINEFEMASLSYTTSPYTGRSIFPTVMVASCPKYGLEVTLSAIAINNWINFWLAPELEDWNAPTTIAGTYFGVPVTGFGFIFFQPV